LWDFASVFLVLSRCCLMNRTRMLLALVASALACTAAEAASVTFTIYPNQNAAGAAAPGEFRVTAQVAGDDNAGLASYGLEVVGSLTSVDHRSPNTSTAQRGSQTGPAGFSGGRSADNLQFLLGSQGAPTPPVFPIYGFGRTASSFAAEGLAVSGPDMEGSAWDAELLLATGAFTGSPPRWNDVGGVFGATVYVDAISIITRFPDEVRYVVVPEPGVALLGVAAVAGCCWLVRGRRAGDRSPR
jgi:hypothetical protein